MNPGFWQVLFLVEPVDEVALTNLKEFKDKKFVDISREDLELGKLLSFFWSKTRDLFITTNVFFFTPLN